MNVFPLAVTPYRSAASNAASCKRGIDPFQGAGLFERGLDGGTAPVPVAVPSRDGTHFALAQRTGSKGASDHGTAETGQQRFGPRRSGIAWTNATSASALRP